MTVDSLWGQVWQRLPFVIGIAIALAAIGAAAAWMAGRLTRRIAGDLPASAVRDAVSSYESVRTLGEALRAQTHEHGNRMHTAVALIELGRGDEAVELLTETARSSQALVDQVVARDGDPTVAALLLGKASQAKERGVEWRTDMQPGIPRTTLSPVDAVSLVGNLIDNGIDAAAAGPEPRWMEVGMAQSSAGDIVLTFRDSGDGRARRAARPRLRARIQHEAGGRRGTRSRTRARPFDRRRRGRHRRAGGLSDHPARHAAREGIRMIGVLIVDDERLTRELHAQYVERVEGFQVVGECSGARAAVTAVLERGDAIDLVLLDMTMPDGSGLDVARFIRSRAADVDIMAITGGAGCRQRPRGGRPRHRAVPREALHLRDLPRASRAVPGLPSAGGGHRRRSHAGGDRRAARRAATRSVRLASQGPGARDARPGRRGGPDRRGDLGGRGGGELGMSRVAARRYLEHLADEKRVDRSARYGTPGRPETEYVWR